MAELSELASPVALCPQVRLEQLAELRLHEERVWHAAWHPTGKLIATCGGDKTVRLWSRCSPADARAAVVGCFRQPVPTPETEADADRHWRCIATLADEHTRTVRSVEWSPDGERLACASFDATVTVWRRCSLQFDMEVESVLDGHENEVKAAAWSPCSRSIATCSRDKSVWVWECEGQDEDGGDGAAEGADREYECAQVLTGHLQDVKHVVWHPDRPKCLLSASYDDTIRVWEETPGQRDDWHCTQTLAGHSSTVWDISFQRAQSGKRLLASASADETVGVWTEADGKWRRVATSAGVHTQPIYSVDWAPALAEGPPSVFASAAGDDCLAVCSVVLGDDGELTTVPVHVQRGAHAADINCVRFSPIATGGSALMATVGDDQVLRVWRLLLEN